MPEQAKGGEVAERDGAWYCLTPVFFIAKICLSLRTLVNAEPQYNASVEEGSFLTIGSQRYESGVYGLGFTPAQSSGFETLRVSYDLVSGQCCQICTAYQCMRWNVISTWDGAGAQGMGVGEVTEDRERGVDSKDLPGLGKPSFRSDTAGDAKKRNDILHMI